MKCTRCENIKRRLKSWLLKKKEAYENFKKELQEWRFKKWQDVAYACAAMRESPSVRQWLIVGKKVLQLLAEAILSEVMLQFLKIVVEIVATEFLKMF